MHTYIHYIHTYTTLHHITSHHITSHHITSHHITPHHITSHYIHTHIHTCTTYINTYIHTYIHACNTTYITPTHITLHHVVIHHLTSHYTTSRCTTLHCMHTHIHPLRTYMHMHAYMHTFHRYLHAYTCTHKTLHDISLNPYMQRIHTSQHITSRFIPSQLMSLHHTTSHVMAWHYIYIYAYIPTHMHYTRYTHTRICIQIRACIHAYRQTDKHTSNTLHHITLNGIALHDITLHHISYIHIHTFIHTYIQ